MYRGVWVRETLGLGLESFSTPKGELRRPAKKKEACQAGSRRARGQKIALQSR